MGRLAEELLRLNRLVAAVARVREIHQPAGEYVHRCQVCHVQWPCNTARVLHSVEGQRDLAAEMRVAADTLETASRLYDAFSPTDYEWSAAALRAEAVHVDQGGAA